LFVDLYGGMQGFRVSLARRCYRFNANTQEQHLLLHHRTLSQKFFIDFFLFYVGRREGERENVEKSIHDVRKKFSCDDKNIGALNFSTIKKHSAMRA
jgi:hypothetical protein